MTDNDALCYVLLNIITHRKVYVLKMEPCSRVTVMLRVGWHTIVIFTCQCKKTFLRFLRVFTACPCVV